MAHYHEVLDEIRAPYKELQEAIPGVLSGYAEIHRSAMGEGDLPAKTKELIALAIAITRECDGCIAAHARGAARRGATAAEVKVIQKARIRPARRHSSSNGPKKTSG